jgi:arylsulfatase
MAPFDDRDWRLYDTTTDPTETKDLAAAHPNMVSEMSRRWDEIAAEGSVFPLEDGSGVFFHQRPAHHRPTEPATFWAGLPTVERIRSRDLIWNRSFRVDLQLGVGKGD